MLQGKACTPLKGLEAVGDLKFLIDADNKTFKYSFGMKNTGSTPAQIFELRYACMAMTYVDVKAIEGIGERRYNFINPAFENFTLSAGQYIKTTTHDPMPFLPDLVLFALGYVKYRDIFNVEQRTNFAFKYCGEGRDAELVTIAGFNTAT